MLAIKKLSALRGAISYYLYFIITAASLFIITRAVSSTFGTEGYSIWSLIYSFLPLFLLFDIGINTSISHIVGKKVGENKILSLRKYYGTFILVLGIFTITLLICGVTISYLAPKFLNIPANYLHISQITLFIIVISAIIQLVAAFFNAIVYGHDMVVLSRVLLIIQQFSFISITLLFLWAFPSKGIAVVAFAHLLANLINLSVSFYFAKNRIAGYCKNPACVSEANLKTFKSLFPFAFRVFIGNIASRLNFGTDHIIIAIALGVVDLGAYDIAIKLCFYATYLASAVSYSTFPKFATKFHETSSKVSVRGLFFKTQTLSMLIGVITILLLLMMAEAFTILWVGKDLLISKDVFLVILSMNIIHVFSGPSANVLTAIGKNKQLIRCEVICAIFKILLSSFLCLKFGLLGVPLGTITASAITSGWYLPRLACRHFNLKFLSFVLKTSIIPLIVLLIGFMVIEGLDLDKSSVTNIPAFFIEFFFPASIFILMGAFTYFMMNSFVKWE